MPTTRSRLTTETTDTTRSFGRKFNLRFCYWHLVVLGISAMGPNADLADDCSCRRAVVSPASRIVALDRALRFESPHSSRSSMDCSCALRTCIDCCCPVTPAGRRAGCPGASGRRRAGRATASCRAIISPPTTAARLTPRELRFCARRAATSAPGISIRSQVITGTMAPGAISAGRAFTVAATMAAALARAGHGRRSGRSGTAADHQYAARALNRPQYRWRTGQA